MVMNITINTDNNYIQHCLAMLCSLYHNNNGHSIKLHVLTRELSHKNRDYIEQLTTLYNNEVFFYQVDESLLEGVQFRKNRPLTKAAYYRLLLSTILSESIDKVLYLDCDMIVLRDISSIFKIEIDNYALAATRDNGFPYTNKHRMQLHLQVTDSTFCSGLMLVNLKYWRDNGVERMLLEYAKRHRDEVFLHDQDVLNYVFKGKWFALPPKWNRGAYSKKISSTEGLKQFDYAEYYREPIVLHYSERTIKPWYNCSSYKKKEYVKYLSLSGYPDIYYSPVTLKQRMKCYNNLIQCSFFEYIYPYVPKLLVLLLYDIKDILLFVLRLCSFKVHRKYS